MRVTSVPVFRSKAVSVNRFLCRVAALTLLMPHVGLCADPPASEAAAPTSAEPTSTVTFSSTIQSTPTPKVAPDEQIRLAIEKVVNDPRIKVTVVNVGKGSYTAVLRGALNPKVDPLDPEDRTKEAYYNYVKEIFEAKGPVKKVVTELKYSADAKTRKEALKAAEAAAKAAAEAAAKPRIVTEQWRLAFTPDVVKSSLPGSTASSEVAERYKIDTLVTALNATFGTKDKPVVSAARNTLMMKGQEKDVLEMKRHLVFLDAPGPQVQLDMWALQISGNGPELDRKVRAVNEKLLATRSVMRSIVPKLGEAIRSHQIALKLEPPPTASANDKKPRLLPPDEQTQRLKILLKEVGFDENSNRPLSLVESLIFLSIMKPDDRAWVLNSFETEVKLAIEYFRRNGQTITDQSINFSRLREAFHSQYPRSLSDGKLPYDPVKDPEPFRTAIENFLIAQKNYLDLGVEMPTIPANKSLVGYDLWRRPETLSRHAAKVDDLFNFAVDALTTDLQRIFLEPLVADLKQSMSTQNGRVATNYENDQPNTGTDLLGRTRIVVTSGLQAGLAPTMSSSVDVTRPAPINVADVTGTLGEDGLASMLPNLTKPQAVLLATALSEPRPSYAQIAPGVAVNVRPSVMRSGVSARLQIDARFGVETKFPDTTGDNARTDVLPPQPFDGVQSHHVSTDAEIDSLDLFGLSSFNINTRTPQGPFVVPILGRVPILGQMFRFPKKDVRKTHYSVILVNTIILPRTLEVTQFYGTEAIQESVRRVVDKNESLLPSSSPVDEGNKRPKSRQEYLQQFQGLVDKADRNANSTAN